jgi:histidinol dehydrogenase
LRLSTDRAAHETLPEGFEQALEVAIEAVEAYHRLQRHDGFREHRGGVTWEERRRPLARVGVYVPGGRAAYPSTAVMTVIPARVAGVKDIAVATPPAAWRRNPALRYTLERLGVDEIWGMGGAHGIAALAYGTESVRRVDKIVGPGNAWVTAAKKRVMGDVAIDGLAGPSEVVIVALGTVDPALVAADLLAQAEHDPQAMAVLVTDRRATAEATATEVELQLAALATAETARTALTAGGGAVVVADAAEALGWIEDLAPEHLQLLGAAEELAPRVERAGAIFLGEATPVVFGDYLAGPSHVLPTAGTARFASALGVDDFVRRTHLVRFDDAASRRVANAAALLAQTEGLPAHAAAARRRAGGDES